MRKRRKAQMEIMGLAIIVILIFLGMVFVIKFVVLKEPKQYKQEYTNTELASNIIGAMLYTTTEDCSMVTFAKLFQDCAAGDPGSICCSEGCTEQSCEYIRREVNDILEGTLGELNLRYYFRVEAGETKIMDIPENKPCPGERKEKRYPLPGAQTIYVILDICS